MLATTGCLGFVTGSEPLSYESDDVAVRDSALSDTDYESIRTDTPKTNATVTAVDQQRTVKVTSHLRVYGRATDVQVSGVNVASDVTTTRFMVLSTPKAEVAGHSMNPIADRSVSELMGWASQGRGGVSNIEFIENRTVQSLGEERTVSTYLATAQLKDATVPVYLHTATFAHGDDYITVIAIHPKSIEEHERIDRLLQGLEHPAKA